MEDQARCLGVLREINGIAKLSSKNLIQLYIGLVRPVLEYGCLAWQTATSHDLKPLEIIQKKALSQGSYHFQQRGSRSCFWYSTHRSASY